MRLESFVQDQRAAASAIAPGFAVCLTIAAAAFFLSEHYAAPVMLFALLLGLALGFLAEDARLAPGFAFAGRTLLRIGVALLGLRVSLGEVASLGWEPFALVLAGIAATITLSMLAARALGFDPLFGLLTGGATAICGASAALAISAALPAFAGKERATTFTVIAVSVLSTLAMIAYPIVARAAGLGDGEAGVFFGAAIHDVAQVLGAGYGLSPEAGEAATIVKLTRVALLAPVIFLAAALTRRRAAEGTDGPAAPLLPWFAVAFLALMGVNSLGVVPEAAGAAAGETSRWCLVAAIAAVGMKTSLKDLARMGPRPVGLMVGQTVFLAGVSLAALIWLIE